MKFFNVPAFLKLSLSAVVFGSVLAFCVLHSALISAPVHAAAACTLTAAYSEDAVMIGSSFTVTPTMANCGGRQFSISGNGIPAGGIPIVNGVATLITPTIVGTTTYTIRDVEDGSVYGTKAFSAAQLTLSAPAVMYYNNAYPVSWQVSGLQPFGSKGTVSGTLLGGTSVTITDNAGHSGSFNVTPSAVGTYGLSFKIVFGKSTLIKNYSYAIKENCLVTLSADKTNVIGSKGQYDNVVLSYTVSNCVNSNLQLSGDDASGAITASGSSTVWPRIQTGLGSLTYKITDANTGTVKASVTVYAIGVSFAPPTMYEKGFYSVGWAVTGSSSYSGNIGGTLVTGGSIPVNQGSAKTFTVNPQSPGNHTLTFAPTGAKGISFSYVVNPLPAASVSASSLLVGQGGTVTLNYSSANASSLSLYENGSLKQALSGSSGSVAVTVNATSTYYVKATNPGGSTSSPSIVVSAVPVSSSLSSSVPTIEFGSTFNLDWGVSIPGSFAGSVNGPGLNSGAASSVTITDSSATKTITAKPGSVGMQTYSLSVAGFPSLAKTITVNVVHSHYWDLTAALSVSSGIPGAKTNVSVAVFFGTNPKSVNPLPANFSGKLEQSVDGGAFVEIASLPSAAFVSDGAPNYSGHANVSLSNVLIPASARNTVKYRCQMTAPAVATSTVATFTILAPTASLLAAPSFSGYDYGAAAYQTPVIYSGQDFKASMGISGNDWAGNNMGQIPADAVYFISAAKNTQSGNQFLSSTSGSGVDYVARTNGGLYFPIVPDIKNGAITVSGQPFPEAGTWHGRIVRDGVPSGSFNVSVVQGQTYGNAQFSEPSGRVAGMTGAGGEPYYLSEQAVNVDSSFDLTSGMPAPSSKFFYFIPASQDCSSRAGAVGVKQWASSLTLNAPSVSSVTAYRLCMELKGKTSYGQDVSVYRFRSLFVHPVTLAISGPSSVPFAKDYSLKVEAVPGYPLVPSVVSFKTLGPLLNCSDTGNIAGIPVTGKPTAQQLQDGSIPMRSPENATGEALRYKYELVLNMNGATKKAVSNCISYSNEALAANVPPVPSPEAGTLFALPFTVGPSYGSPVTGTVSWTPLQLGSEGTAVGTSGSQQMGGADIAAGRVTLTAPGKTGTYRYSVSFKRESDGVSAGASRDVDVARPDNAGTEKVLVPTVYVLTYNDNAASSTADVFQKILKNMGFFSNVPGITSEAVASFRRDYARFTDLLYMKTALERYRVSNGTFPMLAAGSFIPGITTSKWPSWAKALGTLIGNAPTDPINAFGNDANFRSKITVAAASAPDAANAVTLTADGRAAGLLATWNSSYPVQPAGVTKVLATDKKNAAAAWEKKFANDGAVVRLFDSQQYPSAANAAARDQWVGDLCAAAAKKASGLNCGATSNRAAAVKIAVSSPTASSRALAFAWKAVSAGDAYQVQKGDYVEYEIRADGAPGIPSFVLDNSSSASSFDPTAGSGTAILAHKSSAQYAGGVGIWTPNRVALPDPSSNASFNVIRAVRFGESTPSAGDYSYALRNVRIVTKVIQDGKERFVTKKDLMPGASAFYGISGAESASASVYAYPVGEGNAKAYVYYDHSQASPSAVAVPRQDSMALRVAGSLALAGAQTLDAPALGSFFSDEKNGPGTVVVMAHDAVPSTAFDVDQPAYRSLLRRYLDRGGSVVFYGARPGAVVSSGMQLLSVADRFANAESEFMADYVNDPCPGHDPDTCWSDRSKTFACPYQSHLYVYRALSPERFQLSANFENPGMKWGLPLLSETWPGTTIRKVTNYVSECTDPASLAAYRSGVYSSDRSTAAFCGDGIVQAPNESCESGDVRNACDARKYYRNATGGYSPIPAKYLGKTKWHGTGYQQCSASCGYSVVEKPDGSPAIDGLDAQCGGFCGDGIAQRPSESCDGSFDPLLSAQRCEDGSLPSCGPACGPSCGAKKVTECNVSGAKQAYVNVELPPEYAGAQFSFQLLSANGSLIKAYSTTLEESNYRARATFGPVPVLNAALPECAYQGRWSSPSEINGKHGGGGAFSSTGSGWFFVPNF